MRSDSPRFYLLALNYLKNFEEAGYSELLPLLTAVLFGHEWMVVLIVTVFMLFECGTVGICGIACKHLFVSQVDHY